MPRPDPQTYLGGHDAAPALGLAPFGRTRAKVFGEKTGRIPHDPPTQYLCDKGLQLERLLADWYVANRDGIRKIANIDGDVAQFKRHTEEPIMAGHPDGVASTLGRLRLVEFKVTQRREYWSEPPDDYAAQVLHYGCILKSHYGDMMENVADLVVDHGDRKGPTIFEIPLVPEVLAQLLAAERELWYEFIDKDIEPPPEDLDEAKARWECNDETVIASPNMLMAIDQLNQITAEIKEREERKDALKLAIQRSMGAAGTMIYKGRQVCTWKERAGKQSIDQEALAADGLKAKYTKTGERYRVFLPKKVPADLLKEAHETVEE